MKINNRVEKYLVYHLCPLCTVNKQIILNLMLEFFFLGLAFGDDIVHNETNLGASHRDKLFSWSWTILINEY